MIFIGSQDVQQTIAGLLILGAISLTVYTVTQIVKAKRKS